MNNKNDKLAHLVDLANKTDEEIEKMNYKEKQKVYKAKSSLGKIVFISKDKNGNGKTYKKMIVNDRKNVK